MQKITILLAGLLTLGGCKKIEEGFLSDTIRYKSQDIFCQRGLPMVQSDAINLDGSTPPVTFRMLNLRDSSGKAAPAAFTTKYDVLMFKPGMSFDIKTDSTVELLNKKRETKNVTPMEFSTVSGQLTFNKASVNLPVGVYTFDLEAKNVRGVKVYNNFGRINIVDPTQDDMFQLEDNVDNAFSDITGTSTGVKPPKVLFKKVSNDGARIILKVTDKNGVPFNPKAGEIIKRGDRPTFENYARFHPVVTTDTAMICDFEVAPFPLANYIDASTNWGHLIYYRIPSKFVAIDGMAVGQFSANPRFAFSIKLEGTYMVEFRLPDAVHR